MCSGRTSRGLRKSPMRFGAPCTRAASTACTCSTFSGRTLPGSSFELHRRLDSLWLLCFGADLRKGQHAAHTFDRCSHGGRDNMCVDILGEPYVGVPKDLHPDPGADALSL